MLRYCRLSIAERQRRNNSRPEFRRYGPDQCQFLDTPTDESDNPLPPESLLLMIALTELRQNYETMRLRGYDNVRRHIGVTTFSIVETNGNLLGKLIILSENTENPAHKSLNFVRCDDIMRKIKFL